MAEINPSEAQNQPIHSEGLHDLPSAYAPDPVFGLLHLPRFIAKIKRHLAGTLPESYQGNFTRGFDGLLCLHLDIEPGEIIEVVRQSANEAEIYARLKNILSDDVKATTWNRQFVQMGITGESHSRLEEIKKQLGLQDRHDLVSFADLIELDEGRLN